MVQQYQNEKAVMPVAEIGGDVTPSPVQTAAAVPGTGIASDVSPAAQPTVQRAPKKKQTPGGGLVGGWRRQGDDSPVKQAWIAAGSPTEGKAYFDFADRARQIMATSEWADYSARHNAKTYAHISSAASDPRINGGAAAAAAAGGAAIQQTQEQRPKLMSEQTMQKQMMERSVLPVTEGEAAWPTPVVPNQPTGGADQSATPMPKPTPNIPAVTQGQSPVGPAVVPQGSVPSQRSSIMDWRAGAAETKANATTRSVQDQELTSKQLSRLLDENGQYIQQARLRAREEAAGGGMLMSSIAAGSGQRAAIEAGMPIAQSDAGVYANTASENMRAQNEMAQANMQSSRQLFGQAMGLDVQSQESLLGRQFSAEQAGIDRTFRANESAAERAFTGSENERSRAIQLLMQERGISADAARQLVDIQFQSRENQLQRDTQLLMQTRGFDFDTARQIAEQQFTASENQLSREQQSMLEGNRLTQDRFNTYVNLQSGREQQLNAIVSSIYSNPNLSAAQQQAAVENARAMFASLTTGTNAALAGGVPQIFASPYTMGSAQAPAATAPPAIPPVALPPSGSGAVPPPVTTPVFNGVGGSMPSAVSAVGRALMR